MGTMLQSGNRALAVVALGLALSLSGCSIKDDRTPCPARLDVDLSDVHTSSVTLTGIPLSLDAFPGRETSYPHIQESIERGGYSLRTYLVPKGTFHLGSYGIAGRGECRIDLTSRNTRTLTIPLGEQMDSLFAESISLEIHSERTYHRLSLHKNFATLSIVFLGEEDGRGPFDVVLEGDIGGVDLQSLSPTEGEFRFKAVEGGKGYFARLPRQKDSSLVLRLYRDGEEVDSYPVGEYIQGSGYCWQSEDLSDIVLSIDRHHTSFSLGIVPWDIHRDDMVI